MSVTDEDKMDFSKLIARDSLHFRHFTCRSDLLSLIRTTFITWLGASKIGTTCAIWAVR